MANPERTGRLVAEKVVPIFEETAVVYKERVTTDTVRLHKRVHEDEQILDIPVQTEAIEVEHCQSAAGSGHPLWFGTRATPPSTPWWRRFSDS